MAAVQAFTFYYEIIMRPFHCHSFLSALKERKGETWRRDARENRGDDATTPVLKELEAKQ